METQTTLADAKGQLSALADVKEAAILEAHPAPKWWMPLIGGLIGPFAVAEHLAEGRAELLLIAGVLTIFLVGAIAESRSTRVRRSKFSVPLKVKVVTGIFTLAMAGAVLTIEPLASEMNRYLLGFLAYLTGVALFTFYAHYVSRAIAECSRNAGAS